MLTWLLACTGAAAPEAEAPPTADADPAAEVVVRSYREADISKRAGHPKVHSYATLDVTRADEVLAAHAANGQLKVNMPRADLARAATLPWAPGQPLAIRARISTSTPGYVVITRATAAAAPVAEPAPLLPSRSWTGRVRLPAAGPGGPVQAAPLVIRDAEAYAAFVDTVPTTRVQKKQPAPPSDDPLLQRPPIDFDDHMLLVARRDDMYVGPEIRQIRPDGDGLSVSVVHPDPGQTVHAARVVDIGTYHAVEVPRVDGEVTWSVVAVPSSGDGADAD